MFLHEMNKLNKVSWSMILVFSIPFVVGKFNATIEHLVLAFRGLNSSTVYIRNKRIILGFFFNEYTYQEFVFFSLLYRDFFEIAITRFSYLSSGRFFSKFQQKSMKSVIYFIKI